MLQIFLPPHCGGTEKFRIPLSYTIPNIFFFLVVLLALFCLGNDTATAQWQQTNGPYGGYVYALAVSGTNLFAGTSSGGVFLSTNNGTSWTAVNTGLTYTYVLSLAVSGTNLFAGTDGGGVFLSTNNGTSWTAVNTGLTNTTVWSLAISGTNLFAGTSSGGVFLSTNNGTSWTAVNTGLTNTYVYSLAVSGTNLFAGTDGGGVFLSTNNGTSWTAVNTGLTNLDVRSLAISGTNLFAGTLGSGVFLSTNNGTSWTAVNTGLTYTYVFSLAVSGTNLFAGTDGGGVWRRPLAEMVPSVTAPTVTTSSASSVTSTSATLNGSVNPNGVATTAWFEWGTSSTLSTFSTTTTQSIGSGTSDVSVTVNLTGLSVNTTYYYRVVGQNSAGITRGSIVSFTTSGIAPIVTTNAASSISSTSATLNGTVNPNGALSTAYFEWGTSSTLSTYSTTASQSIGSGTSDVSVTANLTGLSVNTTYYYRVVGQNSVGTQKGLIVSFTTSGIAPTVTTSSAGSVTSTSATLNGTVNPNGLATIAYFEWGTSSTLSSPSTTESQSIGSGTSAVSVTANLTGLSANTTYYYRVVGQNSAGIQRGLIISFVTSGIAPTVTTSTATSITSTSATLDGSVNANGLSATVTFQYGTTSSYGSTVTATPSPVSGTSSVSVSANVSGLSPNTLYHYRVVATNSAGTSNGSDQTFTTLPAAPAIVTLSSPANGTTNQPTTLTLFWTASIGATTYRLQMATNSSFSPVVFDDSTMTTTSKQVGPLAYNTIYYWRVSAKNSGGSSAPSSSFSFTTSSSTTVSPSTPITFPTNPTSSTDYRLFSVPGIATSVTVGQILSGTQRTDWRIYSDNGAASTYLVELSSSSTLNTGEGYWLLRKGSLSPSLNLTLPPLGSDGTYSIALHSGWNIIGNPFDRSVSWSAVLAANGLSANTPLYEYTGTTTYAQSTTLDPFKGYYFDNRTSNLTSLKIPYPFSLPKVQPVSGPSIDWKVQLIFESDINSDRENYIGIAPSAKIAYDELDQRKPPLFLDQGFLYFPRPEWDAEYSRFSSDFRPSLGNGQVWEFEVSNPRLSQGKITFRGIEQIPAEYDVILINQYNSKPIDLRTTSEYVYQTVSEKMPFKLIVGKKAYIQNEMAKTLPDGFDLAQNFPNPFNPTTAINFKLPRESDVRLEIISLLGQRIVTLAEGKFVPGVYTVVWDGKDQLGKPVASGVYFYRLVAGRDVIQTKKMILTR